MTSYLYSKAGQWVTMACLLLALAGFWGLLVRDEQAIAGDSSERIDSERLTIRRMDLELDRAETLLERYHHNQAVISRFQTGFLENKEQRLVAISDFLDKRTQARGVDKDTVSYQTRPSRDRGLQAYEINMPLLGRYRDIRALIGDIEASDLFLIITELSLDDDTASRGAVRVQLSLVTYFGEVMRE